MEKYSALSISDYARVLCNKDEVVVGNIAFDGRWIKLKANIYYALCNCIESNTDKEIDSVYDKLITALLKIRVLKPKDFNETFFKANEVTIELTTQCNLQCKHCSYAFGGSSEYSEMSTDMICYIAKWCEENDVKRIILTGGEIFCRNDIYNVLSDIRKHFNGSLDIITNGTIIKNSEIDNLLNLINRINISIDGYDENSVKEIRGAHVFQKVVTLINTLKEKGFNDICISCVDTNEPKKIAEFRTFARNLGVKSIIRQLNLKGRAQENFNYNNTDYHSATNGYIKNTTMRCICNNTYNSIFISTLGLISPCAALRENSYHIGQVIQNKDHSIAIDLIQNVPIIEKTLPCSDCNVKYFCADVCISQNNQVYSNKDILQKRCEKRKEILVNSIWGS